MEEYIRKYGVNNFDFYDLTAIIKKEWIMEFCKLLIQRNLNISWQLPSETRSEALDEEVMTLLLKSGFCSMVYAPESGSSHILKVIKKKINIGRLKISMQACTKEGIKSKANLIYGFPSETKKDTVRNFIFVFKLAMWGVNDVTI